MGINPSTLPSPIIHNPVGALPTNGPVNTILSVCNTLLHHIL